MASNRDVDLVRLSAATDNMDLGLSLVTGLAEFERKLVIYWTLATHALPFVNTFPLLVLSGRMGTGKSQTLNIVGEFAYRVHRFSLRGRTLPVIRDELAKCQRGTAVIEEADFAWKDATDFERMLSDRYSQASAEAALKEAVGGSEWETRIRYYFGATALHRRIPFTDPALNGRSVFVHFRADHSRPYGEFNADDPWIADGRAAISDYTFHPPQLEAPSGVAARVFNTYRVPAGVATLIGDDAFALHLRQRLLLETAELKEAQSVEPDGLVLRAIVSNLAGPNGFAFRNVKVSVIAATIWDSYRIQLQPQQVGGIARQLGFQTKNSHGVRVVSPTPVTLLKACEECGYEDEAVSELRAQLLRTDASESSDDSEGPSM